MRASKAFDSGEFEKAATFYQDYLDFNRKSSLTHVKLAELYRDHLGDPFLAAYHYKQLLRYEPNYSDKEAIEIWISSAENDFARDIQLRSPEKFTSQAEVEKLKDDKARLIQYAIKLKKQNAILLNKGFSGNKDSVTLGAGFKEIYTVKSGDNLQKISRAVYGSSKYYKFIYNANSDKIKSDSELQIGDKLKIPLLNINK